MPADARKMPVAPQSQAQRRLPTREEDAFDVRQGDADTFQITEQAGGDGSGPSAVYTHKRDTQVRRPRARSQSVEK